MSEVRFSVRRAANAASPRDLATALIASRRLAGRDMTEDEAKRIIRNLGLSDEVSAIVDRANALADANRENVRGMVERHDPELVATLARLGLDARVPHGLDDPMSDIANVAALARCGGAQSSSIDEFIEKLKFLGYLLAGCIGLVAAYFVLVSPYYLFEWMWGEDYWDWNNHATWSVVFAILFWVIPILAIIFRRHLGRLSLAAIRAVRRGFRRIEENTRPESVASTAPRGSEEADNERLIELVKEDQRGHYDAQILYALGKREWDNGIFNGLTFIRDAAERGNLAEARLFMAKYCLQNHECQKAAQYICPLRSDVRAIEILRECFQKCQPGELDHLKWLDRDYDSEGGSESCE